MEDNAPALIHRYHNAPREQLQFQKLVWPANCPDLNTIKTIWCEMKDRIKERSGIQMMAAGALQVVLEERLHYPLERINMHINSMQSRIEACILDDGGNAFNY